MLAPRHKEKASMRVSVLLARCYLELKDELWKFWCQAPCVTFTSPRGEVETVNFRGAAGAGVS